MPIFATNPKPKKRLYETFDFSEFYVESAKIINSKITKNLYFFYGTLKQNNRHNHLLMKDKAVYIGRGMINGAGLAVVAPGVPALIKTPSISCRVYGEVWEIWDENIDIVNILKEVYVKEKRLIDFKANKLLCNVFVWPEHRNIIGSADWNTVMEKESFNGEEIN